jgi:hypothetical protein
MDKMFDLDVQVQQTTVEKEVSWFTQSLFCSIGTDTSCWQDPM